MKKSFKFESNKKFLNGKSAAGLDIALPDANLALIKAVENNKPFQNIISLPLPLCVVCFDHNELFLALLLCARINTLDRLV